MLQARIRAQAGQASLRCAALRHQHNAGGRVSRFAHPAAARYYRSRNGLRCFASAEAKSSLASPPWTGSQEQVEALEALRTKLATTSSSGAGPSDETLTWFLRDRYFNADDAATKITAMLAWRQEFQADTITAATVAAELATGKASVLPQPDTYGRPILFIRTAKHVTGQFPIADSKRLCVHMIEQAISALPPGKEQFLGLFDLRGFSVANSDLEFASFLIEAFFKYYPRRVGQVLLVESPWLFKPLWQVLKPLMGKYSALVRFVSVDDLKKEFFTPETLPAEFK